MNFALLLFSLLVVTGVVSALDAVYFGKRRAAGAKEPWWIEYPKSFFPVILIVFLLRSFLVEPFKIPSGSMIPTLLVGDFILVNKFTYGIRLPVINKKIIDINLPERGDVMVFRYPEDPSVDYIKRVVGLPGDKVAYEGKRLSVNGREVLLHEAGDFLLKDKIQYLTRYTETLGNTEHSILLDTSESSAPHYAKQFPQRENCIYNNSAMVCKVPPGHYFMMGDNRDNSSDSRVWGFVPEANIVGKAFFIWFNFSELRRFGRFS